MRGCLLAITAALLVNANAASNIDPAHSLSSSEFLGTLDWRAAEQTGAVINPYFCSGFIYGHAVGWISLGTGTPANGLAYRNDSSPDYGVNVSASGELSGFAYGANIGWINFTGTGNPRVDWMTGRLSGSAWSANAGWIPLSSGTQYLGIIALPQLPDADGDALPDPWEIQIAGSTSALSGNTDADHDGQTDLQEYLAGTNPFDLDDFWGPLRLTVTSGTKQLAFPTKRDRVYQVEQRAAFGAGLWSPAPVASVAGTGETVSVRLQANAAQLFFYRVVGYPPLTRLPQAPGL